MIKESKKLFFKKVLVILEDDKIEEIIDSKKYASVIILSHQNFDLTGFWKKEKTTALIELDYPEDEIFRKFNDTTRNEIRKTYKLPDLKFVSGDKNFSTVFDLYKKFEYARGEAPFSKDALESCLIFSAYLNGEVISGIFVDRGEKGLRIRYIFSKRLETEDKELYKIIAYATRRVMWEICLWGKSNSFHFVDLASVNFKNPDVSSITKFKMSFGGRIINEYTYTYKSAVFSFFERLAAVKNLLNKIFKI